jgi:hypothetical protein
LCKRQALRKLQGFQNQFKCEEQHVNDQELYVVCPTELQNHIGNLFLIVELEDDHRVLLGQKIFVLIDDREGDNFIIDDEAYQQMVRDHLSVVVEESFAILGLGSA